MIPLNRSLTRFDVLNKGWYSSRIFFPDLLAPDSRLRQGLVLEVAETTDAQVGVVARPERN